MLAFLFLSCAHKSGHRERNRVSYSNTTRIQSSKEDTKVEIRSNRGDKMDGSEVFRKYSKAVFMVFTAH